MKDEFRCGLKKWRTANWDPFMQRGCRAHDREFQAKIDGKPHNNLASVSAQWVYDTTLTALIGAYAVATLPLYLAGGLIGGAVRWFQIGRE